MFETLKKTVSRDRTCKSCEHWVKTPESDYGACRRYPPTVTLVGMGKGKGGSPEPLTSTNWPATFPAQWCGEWRPKELPPGAS